jgi:hypothetical protein
MIVLGMMMRGNDMLKMELIDVVRGGGVGEDKILVVSRGDVELISVEVIEEDDNIEVVVWDGDVENKIVC